MNALSTLAASAPPYSQTLLLILPMGWALATSPLPLAALVAMLLTDKPVRASVTFTLTWTLGMIALIAAASTVGSTLLRLTPKGHKDDFVTISLIAIGLLAILIGITVWWRQRGKDHSGQRERTRRILDAAAAAGPRRALEFGLIAVFGNVTNYPCVLAIALVMARGELTAGQAALAVLVGALVASCTFIAVTIAVFAARARMVPLLGRGREYVIKRSSGAVYGFLLGTGLVLVVIGVWQEYSS